MVTEKQHGQKIRNLIVCSLSIPILGLGNIFAASASPIDIGAKYFVGQMGPEATGDGMAMLSSDCSMKGQLGPMSGPPPGAIGIGPPGGPPPPPYGFCSGGPPMMMSPPPGIELQDDQIEKISQLKSNFFDSCGPIEVKLRSLEHRYRHSLLNSQLNVSELNKMHAQISEQKAALDDLLNQYTIEMHSVLTSSQRQDVRLRMEKMQLGQFPKPHLRELSK